MKYFKLMLVAVSVLPAAAAAYEIDTHSRLTERAYEASVFGINSRGTLRRLGLDKSRPSEIGINGLLGARINLGDTYYDVSGNALLARGAKTYDQLNTGVMKKYGLLRPKERWQFSQFNNKIEPLFPRDWLARGVVREDDTKLLFATLDYWEGELNAYDTQDALPQLNRFCNHFYDPVANAALNLGVTWKALFACDPTEVLGASPQWALGANNVDGSGGVNASRFNHFSVQDAREAMWRALTGTTNDGALIAASAGERDRWWATTFRALGGVVHHLQDMAQPQHTRNEPHAYGDAGLLEKTINEWAMGITTERLNANDSRPTAVPPRSLIYDGYSAPTFTRYQHFFSTGIGAASYTGLGIANYSNQGFLTAQANIGNNKYAMPPANASAYTASTNGNGESYLLGDVRDYTLPLPAGSNRIPMTRESIFAAYIPAEDSTVNVETTLKYSIDTNVIERQAQLLLPRAVGYSAGFINFFFRGQLEVKPTTDNVFGVLDYATASGYRTVVARVKNTTASITDPVTNLVVSQRLNGGKFVAVVRFHRDITFREDLSQGIGRGDCATLSQIYGAGNEPNLLPHDPTRTTSCRDGNETMVVSAPVVATLEADEEKEMRFDFSGVPVPVNGVDYSLQVIYRGALGNEPDDIATGYRELADPMFITRHNMYDQILTEHSGAPLWNNLFGADKRLENQPNVKPLFFAPTSARRWDFANFLKFSDHQVACWSFFAIDFFRCFTSTTPVRYSYTLGPRTQPPIAEVSTTEAGRYTQIAILAPLWQTGEIAQVPSLRVGRINAPNGPFMGENIALPQRHRSDRVAWPVPMRGVNSWHSDGYAWRLPTENGIGIEPLIAQGYCSVFPQNGVSGVNARSVFTTGTITATLPGDNVSISAFNVVTMSPTVIEPQLVAYSTNPRVTNCATITYAAAIAAPAIAYYSTMAREPANFSSAFSAWDVYLGTTNYSNTEFTAPGEFGDVAPLKRYVADESLREDGEGLGSVKARLPVPMVISAKYR